jgi:hypothetical protein
MSDRDEARRALSALLGAVVAGEERPSVAGALLVARLAGKVEVWARVIPDLPPAYSRAARSASISARRIAELSEREQPESPPIAVGRSRR